MKNCNNSTRSHGRLMMAPVMALLSIVIAGAKAAAASMPDPSEVENLPKLSWSMALTPPGFDENKAMGTICATEMGSVETKRTTDCVTTLWRGHKSVGAGFTVVAKWTRGGGGVWLADFSFSGYESTNFIDTIAFPILEIPANATSTLEYVSGHYGTGQQGRLLPGKKLTTFGCNAGGLQLLDLSDGSGRGWHFDVRDPRGGAGKVFSVERNSGVTTVSLANDPPFGYGNSPSRSFTMPYQAAFAKTSGDWWEGAQIYKAWSDKQYWARSKPMNANIGEIALWVWNRTGETTIGETVPLLKEMQKRIGAKMGFDWYWWHAHGYDAHYPDFWPPRMGVKAFRDAIAKLHECDILTSVYMHGMVWDKDTDSFNAEAIQGLTIRRDGRRMMSFHHPFLHHTNMRPCGAGGIGAKLYFDRLADEIRKVVDAGVDGVYLDVLTPVASEIRCWAKNHNHRFADRFGPFEGYRRFVERMRRENPGTFFTSELTEEDMLDVLDGFKTVNDISAERIRAYIVHSVSEKEVRPCPVFQAVHHGSNYAGVQFGSYASPSGHQPFDPLWGPKTAEMEAVEAKDAEIRANCPDQFFIEFARPIIYGSVPMICNIDKDFFESAEYVPHLAYTVRGVKFREANLAFLRDGTLMSQRGFKCNKASFSFDTRGIYARDRAQLVSVLPTVIHGVWRTADGAVALFLANPTGKVQKWTYSGPYASQEVSGELPPRTFRKINLTQL